MEISLIIAAVVSARFSRRSESLRAYSPNRPNTSRRSEVRTRSGDCPRGIRQFLADFRKSLSISSIAAEINLDSGSADAVQSNSNFRCGAAAVELLQSCSMHPRAAVVSALSDYPEIQAAGLLRPLR